MAGSLAWPHRQRSAVLGVKPAVEDVDAGGFLAFPFAQLKTESSPTQIIQAEQRVSAVVALLSNSHTALCEPPGYLKKVLDKPSGIADTMAPLEVEFQQREPLSQTPTPFRGVRITKVTRIFHSGFGLKGFFCFWGQAEPG